MCYWDGFGIGTDHDQQELLRRMTTWLRPDGCVLMDVFNPAPWVRVAGTVRQHEPTGLMNRRNFDPLGCRFLDPWWPVDDPAQEITQSIRCYTPPDFLLLLEGTGLRATSFDVNGEPFEPGEQSGRGHGRLWDAFDYRVKLIRAS